MLTLLDSLVFVGALGVSGYAIGGTVGPNLGRIGDALAGRPQPLTLEPRVKAARRAAVRRWADTARPARLREAA